MLRRGGAGGVLEFGVDAAAGALGFGADAALEFGVDAAAGALEFGVDAAAGALEFGVDAAAGALGFGVDAALAGTGALGSAAGVGVSVAGALGIGWAVELGVGTAEAGALGVGCEVLLGVGIAADGDDAVPLGRGGTITGRGGTLARGVGRTSLPVVGALGVADEDGAPAGIGCGGGAPWDGSAGGFPSLMGLACAVTIAHGSNSGYRANSHVSGVPGRGHHYHKITVRASRPRHGSARANARDLRA